jgi:hypothetical protein
VFISVWSLLVAEKKSIFCSSASQPASLLVFYIPILYSHVNNNNNNNKEIKWCHVGATSSQIHIYKTQEFRSKNKNQVILYVRKSQKGDKPNNNNNNKITEGRKTKKNNNNKITEGRIQI